MPAARTRKVSDRAAVYAVARPRVFADSNIPLYLLSEDTRKAGMASAVLSAHCAISVQVLNEISSVMHRKYRYDWVQIAHFLDTLRAQCLVEPLTEEIHDTARQIAERYGLQFYDALIASAALHAGCDILYSEDMHHGLLLEGRLRIIDPFVR